MDNDDNLTSDEGLKERERHRTAMQKSYNRTGKRTMFEREVDLVDEARWYLQGYTLPEITSMLGEERSYSLSWQSIQNDMKTIRERWRDRYIRDYDEAKAQELAKLDQLEIAYWEAWEISKKEKEETEAIQSGVGEGKKNKITSQKLIKKKKTRDPNAVYLQGIERCIEKRMRILGLNMPKTVNVNWRQEATDAGLDPDKIENDLVEQFVNAASTPRDDENSREDSD